MKVPGAGLLRMAIRPVRQFFRMGLGIAFYFFGILATVGATIFTQWWAILGILVGGLVLSATFYYSEYHRPLIQVKEEQIERFLEDFLFPGLLNDYYELRPNTPEIRANVMLYKRRDVLFWRESRSLPPWEKSLSIDFRTEGYGPDVSRENELKWRVGEGVCGGTIEYVLQNTDQDSKEEFQEAWSDLENVHIAQWNMTQKQFDATKDLGSVLSVPIYRPDDLERKNPVGILNLDSEANLSETKFHTDDTRQVAIKYAKYIGALV